MEEGLDSCSILRKLNIIALAEIRGCAEGRTLIEQSEAVQLQRREL